MPDWTVRQCLTCLLQSDAMRRPERLHEALDALTCMATAGALAQSSASGVTSAPTHVAEPFAPLAAVERLKRQLQRLQSVDTSAASAQALAQGLRGPAIGEHIRRAQEEALEGT
jgi:spore germination cell wall hydrolase CwlJ-like protein